MYVYIYIYIQIYLEPPQSAERLRLGVDVEAVDVGVGAHHRRPHEHGAARLHAHLSQGDGLVRVGEEVALVCVNGVAPLPDTAARGMAVVPEGRDWLNCLCCRQRK